MEGERVKALCRKRIAKLNDERQRIELTRDYYYPTGSFGHERCTLAIAFIDLKIAIWQALMGDENETPR